PAPALEPRTEFLRVGSVHLADVLARIARPVHPQGDRADPELRPFGKRPEIGQALDRDLLAQVSRLHAHGVVRRAINDRDGALRTRGVRIALDPAAETDRRLGYRLHRTAVTDVQLERNDTRHQLDDTRAVARTWPADWEQRKRGDGCVMCAQGRPDENEFGIRVYRSDTSDAYLQKADVGQRGYSIVIWRGRHVADVTQLSDSEA